MPRIGVDVLRWLLAGGNAGLIACVVLIGMTFFHLQGEEKGLNHRLSATEKVKVKMPDQKVRPDTGLYDRITRKPPPPPKVREEPKPQPPLPPEIEDAGPLDEKFELAAVIVHPEDELLSTAFLVPKSCGPDDGCPRAGRE